MPLVAFLTAVAYVPGLPSGSELGRWSVILIGAAAFLYLPAARRAAGIWIGAAFLAWCALGLLWSLDPITTIGDLIRWTALAVIVCTAPADLTLCLIAMVMGCAVSSGLALWQFIGGAGEFSSGLFAGKNQAAEMAVPLMVWCTMTRRWGLAAALLPLAALTGAKETVAMLAAAGGVWLLSRPDYPRSMSGRVVGTAVCAVGASAMFAIAIFTNAPKTLGERVVIWGDALRAFEAHPWGWGLGSFPWLFPNYEYAHNDFLQALVELGPGSALLVAIVAIAFRRLDIPERAALAAIMASACLWWPLHAPGSALLTALLVGSSLCVRGPQLDRGMAGLGGLARKQIAGLHVHVPARDSAG